ncbi:cell wall-binding repeat-containing protein [Robertmurraya kyonggiensis]|uniref:N-acetylmuramoyl-L-alanine amidase n=1 Tax=Robertmurraya kyonggiensis TaxID=1037680 RepID=A0A4U1D3K5_9BACI|nr:cell wall-binding repeat-containing protein [Robertmurraya kyonggiensis]TKC16979.1 N-acetylmuramoyl-L-alanine amidase [Robertmurraya kyonggiensis]
MKYPLFLFLLIFTLLLPSTSLAANTVERISGTSRYDTSVAVSQKGWPNGANNVVLAIGDNFPDALTGAPLANALNAPILLTQSSTIPVTTINEIKRLKATKVYILGGPLVISESVVKQLGDLGLTTERLAGNNRYETAVEISKEYAPNSDTAIITYGKNFPDSLSVASYAAENGIPIFLTDTSYLPDVTKEAIKKVKRTIVIGGELAISNNVFAELPNPTRISGDNRYHTSSNIVSSLYQTTNGQAVIATGTNFADALTGSVLAAKMNSPILLVQNNEIPAAISNLLMQKQEMKTFYILGGTTAVSQKVKSYLETDVYSMISTAKTLIGAPYAWGGTTPSGFDCSGFLNYVYSKHGVQLPRTTENIWFTGTSIITPQAGDVVFFETYKTGPSHAGIYIGNNQFIHASTSKGVTISNLADTYYKTRYLGSKSVINQRTYAGF